jgi:hypothetical protein
MQMWAGRAACGSAQAEQLTRLDCLAFGDMDFREVHIDGHELLPVVDDDAVAFVEKIASENHFS